MAARFLDRIVIHPEILTGKPVIQGTRIPVEQVLQDLAEVLSIDALLEAYPRLTADDIRACLEYAHAVVEGETLYPATDDMPSHSTA